MERTLAVRIERALKPVTKPPIAPSNASATKTPNGIDGYCLRRMLTPLNMLPESWLIKAQKKDRGRPPRSRKVPRRCYASQ
jgi:hypothetical protein